MCTEDQRKENSKEVYYDKPCGHGAGGCNGMKPWGTPSGTDNYVRGMHTTEWERFGVKKQRTKMGENERIEIEKKRLTSGRKCVNRVRRGAEKKDCTRVWAGTGR